MSDSTVFPIHDFDISPDLEDCYIRQNLPVRRQSLVVYHDKLRSENQQCQDVHNEQAPTRHYSLSYLSAITDNTKNNNSRLYSSKSLSSIHANNKNRVRLSVIITQPDSHNSSLSSSSTESPYDVPMHTLHEEPTTQEYKQQQQQQQQQSVPKFIGLLRTSKSESTSSAYVNKPQQQYSPTSSLSQSWNDITQPLSKLKNVFSRLHPETEVKRKKKSLLLDNKSKKKKKTSAGVYTALLSHVAKEFIKKMCVTLIALKDGIQYHDVFTGAQAVNCLLDILKTSDRKLALFVGKALENQGLLHHVTYEHRLRDVESELYQFQYIQQEDLPTTFTCKVPTCKLPSPTVSPTTTVSSTNKLLSLKKQKRTVPVVYGSLGVNGVLSPLTDCYSPTCTRKSPCYSSSCPKKTKRNTQSFTPDQELRSLWRHSVPLNIVMNTGNMEQKRQECIYELIYTEEDFAKDMQYIKEFWIKPLQTNDIIPIDRRDEFISEVFWNLDDIERTSLALSRELISRQDRHSIIPSIGDILLKHVEEFEPFVIYGAHQIFGKHKFEMEKKKNYKFLQFVKLVEKHPDSRKLELNGYLTKPTSRLGRYNLLLHAIHQVTPKDHQDYIDIPIVIDRITDYLVQLNIEAGHSDNAFHLQQISSRLLDFKGYDFQLLDSKRQLLMKSKMKRTIQHNNTTFDSTSSADVQLFLLDHYLLFCKVKLHNEKEYYKLYQKPIPLSSLSATIPNTVIIKSNKKSSLIPESIVTNGFPIAFQNLQENYTVTLIAPNESIRKLWIDRVKEEQEKLVVDCL